MTSPNGRTIAFSYDAANRITQATDSIGRTVGGWQGTVLCLRSRYTDPCHPPSLACFAPVRSATRLPSVLNDPETA